MKQKPKGRPKGTGKFGVETKPMRVPVFLWDKVLEFIKKELGL
jgi:hypothetical protein